MNGERDQRRTSSLFAAYSEMKGVSVVGARRVRTKQAVNERRTRKEKARGAASREGGVRDEISASRRGC